jgi:hypothetical protein
VAGILGTRDYNEMIEKKIKELKPKHLQLATIFEGIHRMSLEETVRVLILSEGLEWILKVQFSRLASTQEKIITDEMVEEKTKELRPHHPVVAAILEREYGMNLRDSQCSGCFRGPKRAHKDPRCSACDILKGKRL